jgi:hypothetical protein
MALHLHCHPICRPTQPVDDDKDAMLLGNHLFPPIDATRSLSSDFCDTALQGEASNEEAPNPPGHVLP